MQGTPTMARRRGRPKTSDREDMTVRIDRKIAIRARSVADYRGIPLAEFLSEIARGPVDRAFAQMVRELGKDAGGSD
jgi:hypothetical protein